MVDRDAQFPGILETDRRRSTSDSADDSDYAAHLRREFENLAELHRTVLELKFWGRLNQTQIAERLGVSNATVHRRLLAAYATLRSRLQPA